MSDWTDPATSLAALQQKANEEGRRCVVGALIVERGRVFVHLRGPDRAFLPNCWDIPGGHVEAGESLLEALAREVLEETGWQVIGTPELVHVVDWEVHPGDPSTGRREFDFVVDVDGELGAPRLELPKQVDFRWIGPDETALLNENRGRDDGIVRGLVELAFRLSAR